MVDVGGGSDPLLKRPFSLFRTLPEGFQIFFRTVGKGTSMLKRLKEGGVIDVLGPLGRPYPDPPKDEIPLVAAGGIGIASVYSFLERYPGRAYLFYGARTSGELYMDEEAAGLSMGAMVSTDDGTRGRRGTVKDLIEDFISGSKEDPGRHVIYACGPHPMLRAVSGLASETGLKAYLSLEAQMACGIGACLGCVVRTRIGYSRVCKEGPVFEAGEILW